MKSAWIMRMQDVFFLLTYCFFVFVYQYAFNFSLDIYYYYLLAFINVIGIGFYLTASFNRGFLRSLFLIILLAYQIGYLSSGNEYGIVLSCIGCQILVSKLGLSEVKVLLKVMMLCLVLELLIFLYYFLSGLPVEPEKGPFGNQGVFALYLTLKIPVLVFFIQEKKQMYLKVFFVILLIVTLNCIVLLQSRTSILLILVFFTLTIYYYGAQLSIIKKIPIYIYYTLFGLIISVVSFVLFFVKFDSSMGRLLMLDVAKGKILEVVVKGVGIGKFEQKYPFWQAEYFSKNGYSNPKFFTTAGETYFIFNEPFQFIMTTGISGVLLLIGTIIFLVFQLKSYRDLSNPERLCLDLILLISLSSLTYYTFHINESILVFGFFLLFLIKKSKFSIRVPFTPPIVYGKILNVLLILCLVFLGLFSASKSYSSYRWGKIKELNLRNENNKIYEVLNGDGRFLAEYSHFHHERNGNLDSAIFCLENAMEKFRVRDMVEKLAILYSKTNKVENAINEYEFLSNFMPSKYRYKMELAKQYVKFNKKAEAISILRVIIDMPTKIPSLEVSLIKAEAMDLIKEL